MHISSSIAISLVSGSSTDKSGYLDGYRLMLQLSHSADVSPSDVNIEPFRGVSKAEHDAIQPGGNTGHSGVRPAKDMIWLTDDNALKRNHWHYVSVKWSPEHNNSSGSIRIDDKVKYFKLHSSSYGDANSLQKMGCTFIGNYFEGAHTEIPKFFSKDHAQQDSTVIEMDGQSAKDSLIPKALKVTVYC